MILAQDSFALTATVCSSGCDYATIQAAINNISTGDTIQVKSGTYSEQVFVNKSVNLQNYNSTLPLVQGGFNVTSNYVNITGFNITGGYSYSSSSKAGIYATGNSTKIFNNTIRNLTGGTDGTAVGVYLSSSLRSNVTLNSIHNLTGGAGSNCDPDYCTASPGGSSSGIYLSSSSGNNTLSSNSISNLTGGRGGDSTEAAFAGTGGAGGNSSGIYISSSSSNNTVSSNNMTSLTGGTGGNGLWWAWTTGGKGGSSSGVYISSSSGNTISLNSILSLTGGNGGNGGSSTGCMGGAGGSPYGIYISSSSANNTVSSNNITHLTGGNAGSSYWAGVAGGSPYGIYLFSSSNNTFTSTSMTNLTGGTASTGGSGGNAGTGGSPYGIYLFSSSNNTFTSTSMTNLTGGKGGAGFTYTAGGDGGSPYGIYLFSSSNSNTLDSTSMTSLTGGAGGTGPGLNGTNGSPYGAYLSSSIDNNITGGSIISQQGYDYYLQNASATNNFTQTNFTAQRRIYFADTSSWFNYRNGSSNNIWLRTNVSTQSYLNRTLSNLTATLVKWNDTNSTPSLTARYNLTGLTANSVYVVLLGSTDLYYLFTDAGGTLPSFTVSLSGQAELSVTPPLTVCSSGCGYTTIQAAVNAAVIGDKIYVYDGTYTEQVVVNKTVAITGQSVADTVLQGGFNVTSNGAKIQNFNISGGYIYSSANKAGIYATGNNTKIFNNTIRNITGDAGGNATGIHLFFSSGNDVTLNNMTSLAGGTGGFSSGVYLSSSSNSNTLSNNNIIMSGDYGYGIRLESSNNANISNNNITTYGSSSRGIHLHLSGSNALSGNLISSVFSGFYPEWPYKKAITVNGSSSLLNDYQIPLNITTALYNNTGLVGSWHFLNNDTSDSSGYGNNGVQNGGVNCTADGKFGGACKFDGVNDYVDAGNAASLNFERTNPFSICAWIKKNDLTKDYQSIVGKMSDSWVGYTFFTSGSTEPFNPSALGFILSNTNIANDLVIYSSDNSLNDNNWNYVCVAYSGNSDVAGVSFYINGINQSKETVRNGLSATILNSVNIEIGHLGVVAYPEWFNGTIDEVRIYNRSLSAAEITEQYQAGKARLDYQDLRFTWLNSTSNAEQNISHWLESDNQVWVKAPNVTASSVANTTIYMYYGNPAATYNNTANFDNVFIKEYNATGANDAGLAGEWHFDDGSGQTTAADSSGMGNTGTLSGINTTGYGDSTSGWRTTDGGQWDGRSDVTFASGSALRFDGVDDIVNMPDNGKLDFSNADFTVEAWFKLASNYTANTICKQQPIVANDDYGWKIVVTNETKGIGASVYDSSSSSNGVGSITKVSFNTWYHVVLMFSNSSKKINLYINGLNESEKSIPSGVIYYGGSDQPHIGAITDCGGQNNYFNGTIDEVRIYNRSLSAAEIYRHYIRSKYASLEPSVLTIGAEQTTVSAGIYLQSSTSNNITGGSVVSANGYDYWLQNASTSNNFTDTNFTAQRRIYFADTSSYFVYNNQTSGGIWLRTNVSSVGSYLNRTLSNWNNTLMKWNDTNSTSGLSVSYNLTGLLGESGYDIYNKTGTGSSNPYNLTTNSAGELSFNISLDGNTQISVEKHSPVLTVCSAGCSATTIQGVINMAFTGDIIQVKAGTYSEQVDVNKSVNLQNYNSTLPLVEGGFNITKNYVNITGFNITGGYNTSTGTSGRDRYGIWLNGANYTNVTSNNIYGLTGADGPSGYNPGGIAVGIYLSPPSSSNNTITSNNMTGLTGGEGGYCALCQAADGGPSYGVYLNSSSLSNSTITSNNITSITGGKGGRIWSCSGYPGQAGNGGASYGVYLFSSLSGNTIASNTISGVTGGDGGNKASSYPGCLGNGGPSSGIYLSSSSGNTIASNTISGVTGGMGGDNTVDGGSSNGGPSYGAYFSSSSANNVSSNTFSNIVGGAAGPDGGTTGIPYGFYFNSSGSNNVTGGSVAVPGGYDYGLQNASATNNFTDTNFTAMKGIYFADTTSWFNYQNRSIFGNWTPSGESQALWQYRKPITINGSTTNLSDYQVFVNLTSSNFNFSKANSQGNDTRFTWLNTSSGLEQNISFWIENWTVSGSLGNATIWVKVPNVTASTVANTTLYMYYGNPSASSASNGTNMFAFFDDFSSGTIDPVKWPSHTSNYNITNGVLRTWSNGSDWSCFSGSYDVSLASAVILETRYQRDGSSHLHWGFNYDSPYNRFAIKNIGSSVYNQYAVNELATDSYFYSTSTGTWYVYRIDRQSPTNFRAYVLSDNYSQLGTTSQNQSAWSSLTFDFFWCEQYAVNDYFDWVRVRSYASPEPSVLSVGAEQTNSSVAVSIWLKTNVSTAAGLNRTLSNWNSTLMIWNDTNSTSGMTARYNITGLQTGASFEVYNATSKGRTLSYGLFVDSNGNAPAFTIALDGNTEMEVTPDITPPSITILLPQNVTYTVTTTLSLNYSVSDINLDKVWYLYNGTNTTLNGNTTFTALDNQQSTLWLYANDTAGNTNMTNITFIVDTIPPFIGFISPTDSNNTFINRNWTYVNATISDLGSPNNLTGFIDFNRSLVGWWRFNRETGENDTFARDWSTYGNNGTLTNMNLGIDNGTSGWTSSGKFGNAMQFDGISGYVKIILNN